MSLQTLIAIDLPVVRGALVRLMLSHERDELLGGPALSLEVIVIRRRSPSVHHKINGRSSTQNVGAGNDSLSASEPF